MKKTKLAKQFLSELENNPNVAIACKRVGLSRQTVYRWRQTDTEFNKAVDEAMTLGTESISERNKSSNNECGYKSLADLLIAAHKAKP
jgi:transposase-like protein